MAGSAVYAALVSDGSVLTIDVVVIAYYLGVGLLCVGIPVVASAGAGFLPARVPPIARMALAIVVGWAFIPITFWVWDRCCGV